MATRRWLGNAVQITQVDTITVANTWATNDTVTMTINGKSIVLTIKTDTSTANVATAIKEIWNGDTQSGTGAHISTPTFADGGGNIIPEFREVTASVSGSVVTLTADTAGKPFVLTVTETTAGSGTASEATATAATGKHFFNDTDNWSGSTVPVDSDTVVFDNSDIDCLYAIDQNAVSPEITKIYQSYTGRIGLPEINVDDTAYPYREYRDRFLKLNASGDSVTNDIDIGIGSGRGSQRINMDLHSGTNLVTVHNSGSRELSNIPPVNLKGGGASSQLTIVKGDVGIALIDGDTTTFTTVRMGYRDNRESDAKLYAGANAALTTVNKDGGELESWAAITTLTQHAGVTKHRQGAITTLNGRGGHVIYNSTTALATATLTNDCHLDFSQDLRAKAVTNPVERYGSDTKISDPFNVVGTLVFDNNQTSDLSGIDAGTHVRWTRGSVA